MFEPTQRRVDQNITESMDLFRRAQVGEVPAVDPAEPARVLLAIDGSTQDALGAAVVNQLSSRLRCEVFVVDAREPGIETDGQRAARLAEELGATELEKSAGNSYEQILQALATSASELLVVPCPFGRDFQSVGADSTGTVIDVLLARSPVPLIATRAPFHPQGNVFSQLRIVLWGENEAAPRAASWACGLVHSGGSIELLLVVEEEFYENVREALHAIQPEASISIESLENALLKTHMRLHSGLQKSARELGFSYALHVERESEAQPFTVHDPAATPPLLVLALERADNASVGHVHGRIRRSSNPVLVVPVN